MSPDSLEALALRFVPGDGPVVVRRLAEGLFNQSNEVIRDGERYLLRVRTAAAEDLGLDRHWESRLLRVAAAADLAPRILHDDPDQGVLIAAWLPGCAWTPAQTAEPGSMTAMAGLLRRVHALPAPQPPRCRPPVSWIAEYTEALARAGGALPATVRDLRAEADAVLRRLETVPSGEPRVCHSDLHRLNVVVGDRLRLLDWEYAHVSDPLWDVAGWTANNDWDEAAAGRFFALYLERPPRAEERGRLCSMAWLYDFICILWSLLYLKRLPPGSAPDVSRRIDTLTRRLTCASGGREGEVTAH